MNEICTFNKLIYWSGFFKGIATTCIILIIIYGYKYFKNKKIKVNIEISERKEPKI